MIECKCGCKTMIEAVDSRGRAKQYVRWHSANKGRKFPGLTHDKQFKKGSTPHNKGLDGYTNAGTFKKGHRLSEESIRKMASKLRGKATWNKGLNGYKAGEQHYNWKGGITSETKLQRSKFLKYMVPKVLQRDNYTCQICEQYSGYLHVDHIKAWAEHPELRFDMSNCRTVCRACHYYITFKRKMPANSKWGLSSYKLDRKVG